MTTIIDMPLSTKLNLLARIYARRIGAFMNTYLCPHCQNAIVVQLKKTSSSQSWAVTHGHTFEQTAPWETDFSGQGPVEATRSTPARAATLESDVFVPLLQSLATGVAIAIPSAAMTIWLRWEWYAPVMIGSVTATATWLQLLGAHRKLLWIVETVSSLVDHGNAPEQTRPEPQAVELRIKHTEAGPSSRTGNQILDLPGVNRETFLNWGQQVLAGVKTPAQTNWAGNGKPFSKAEYNLFVASMCEVGILRLKGKDKSQGYTLTAGGRHALRTLIDDQNG